MVYPFFVEGMPIDIDLDANKAQIRCANGRIIERPLTFVKVGTSEQDGSLTIEPRFTIGDWPALIKEFENNK
jgi:hypothetical protein